MNWTLFRRLVLLFLFPFVDLAAMHHGHDSMDHDHESMGHDEESMGHEHASVGHDHGSIEFHVDRGTVVSAVQSGLWSDADTWGGSLPAEGEAVNIPMGVTVSLDTQTPRLHSVYVMGTFTAEEETGLSLDAHWFLVGQMGHFMLGSEDDLWDGEVTFTMWGTDRSENVTGEGIMAFGSKFFAGHHGANIQIHGAAAAKTDWTLLDVHAEPGDTTMVLAEAVNWEAGDRLVLAPSGYDPYEYELLTVTSVSGNEVSFTPALEFRHYGEQVEVPNATGEGTQMMEMRAEVGLLSRNIKFVGGDDSREVQRTIDDRPGYWRGYGIHLMFMAGSTVNVQGVEIENGGQTGLKGRYSFHWHLGGDASGDYIRSSSIHNSFQRAVVVHGTHNTVIEGNVAFNVLNHIYMLEDGSETGNLFKKNLAILGWRPEIDRRNPSDNDFAFFNNKVSHQKSDQSEKRPGGFWLVNGENTVIGNHVAAMIRGIGFFWDTQTTSDGLGTFISAEGNRDNVAHSIWRPTAGGRDRYGPEEAGFGFMIRGFKNGGGVYGDYQHVVLNGATAYKCANGGIWIEKEHVLQNSIVSDSKFGVFLDSSMVRDSVFIESTANDIGAFKNTDSDGDWKLLFGGIHMSPESDVRVTRLGNGPTIQDCTFVGFKKRAAIFYQASRLLGTSTLEGIRFIDCDRKVSFGEHDERPSSALIVDLDGSVTGLGPSSYITTNSGTALTEGAVVNEVDHVIYFSDLKHTQLSVARDTGYPDAPSIGNIGGIPVERGDGAIGSTAFKFIPGKADGIILGTAGDAFHFDLNDTPGHLTLDAAPAGSREPTIMSVDTKGHDFFVFSRLSAQSNQIKVRPNFFDPVQRYETYTSFINSSVSPAFFVDQTNEKLYVRIVPGGDSLVAMKDEFFEDTSSTDEYEWFKSQFGADIMLDASENFRVGLYGDYDKDGIQNIWEYIMGLDPKSLDVVQPFNADFSLVESESEILVQTLFPLNDLDAYVVEMGNGENWSKFTGSKFSRTRLSDYGSGHAHYELKMDRLNSKLKGYEIVSFTKDLNFSITFGNPSSEDLDEIRWLFPRYGEEGGVEDLILSSDYDSWKEAVFVLDDQASFLISNPDADPDLDGLSNREERFLNGNPRRKDAEKVLPRNRIERSAGGGLQVKNRFFKAALDAEYVMVFSEDLAGGNWQPVECEEIYDPISGETQMVYDFDPNSEAPTGFYRLEIR